MRRFALLLVVLGALSLGACSGGDESTATPTASSESTATVEATTTETTAPTAEPAGGVLATKDIFAAVSPSIAFIETPLGTGSGILFQEEWLVSNAHVVWPFERVRVVFSDGTEFLDARVHAWDLMADLAVIQLPPGHGIPTVDFADPSDLPTGSDLFLIGYPAENEQFPQPTISGGVLSRVREWKTAGLTYIQTDAAITGGQSGGALVSDTGKVIGLSGFKFADTFGLALAAPIVSERARSLVDGTDVDSLNDRRLPLRTGREPVTFTLNNYYDQRAFVVRDSVGTAVDVEISGDNDAILDLYDSSGLYIDTVDDFSSGSEVLTFKVDFDIPFIVIAKQLNVDPGEFQIGASSGLGPLSDPDDGRQLSRGRSYIGNMDYPADLDSYLIDLDAGETVTIRVETVNFDPDIVLDDPGNTGDALAYDDNGGVGLFGTDAELTFTAPSSKRFVISVADVNFAELGGYYLIVE